MRPTVCWPADGINRQQRQPTTGISPSLLNTPAPHTPQARGSKEEGREADVGLRLPLVRLAQAPRGGHEVSALCGTVLYICVCMYVVRIAEEEAGYSGICLHWCLSACLCSCTAPIDRLNADRLTPVHPSITPRQQKNRSRAAGKNECTTTESALNQSMLSHTHLPPLQHTTTTTNPRSGGNYHGGSQAPAAGHDAAGRARLARQSPGAWFICIYIDMYTHV